MPTDRDVVATGLETCWRTTWEEARIVMIPNTLELENLYISPALAAEARAMPNLVVESQPTAWPFDASGHLDQAALFPHANQGRRSKTGHGPG